MPTFGTTPWGTDLAKTDKYWIGQPSKWETNLFGYPLYSGVADFIFNNCRMIMETEDKSVWAYDLLEFCGDLLVQGIRWPIEIQNKIPEDRQCKTRLCSLIQKMRYKIAKWAFDDEESWEDFHIKFRSWGDLTRDPYTAFFACAIYLNRLQFIDIVSMPWYLYRRNAWAWHCYLQEPTEENWDKYDITYDHQTRHKKEFVNVLREMRVWAALEVNYKTNKS